MTNNNESEMATIKVKQTKSRIGAPKDQKRTLDALGLTKMNRVVEHEDTPALRGLIRKVHHLVTVVE
jgi:ribosomal protein L30, bacterial/organelle